MEAENGSACNYFFLMPLSQDHDSIISLSRDNKAHCEGIYIRLLSGIDVNAVSWLLWAEAG